MAGADADLRPVNVGPRVEFQLGHYPRIRVWDSRAGRDHFVYLHRLTAYAHGKIDSLWSDKQIHHDDHDGWNNRPENLEAERPEKHSAYHAEKNHSDGVW